MKKSYVLKCGSCGNEHLVGITKLVTPAMIGKEFYPFVYQCPKTSQPVYVKEMPDADVQEETGSR